MIELDFNQSASFARTQTIVEIVRKIVGETIDNFPYTVHADVQYPLSAPGYAVTLSRYSLQPRRWFKLPRSVDFDPSDLMKEQTDQLGIALPFSYSFVAGRGVAAHFEDAFDADLFALNTN